MAARGSREASAVADAGPASRDADLSPCSAPYEPLEPFGREQTNSRELTMQGYSGALPEAAAERSRASGACCAVWPRFFPIVPDENPVLPYWDCFVVVLLLITCLQEPYALALWRVEPDWAVVLRFIIDGAFTIDLLLQFLIAYPRHVQSSARESIWEKRFGRIAARYCAFPLTDGGQAGWFWLDLMTLLPGWICSQANSQHMKHAKVWMVLRLFRLVRLAKLSRMSRLLQRWHERYGFAFYVVDLLKFVLITTMSCHWLACVWLVVETRVTQGVLSFERSDDVASWLSALIAAKGDSCYPSAGENPFCCYVIALYWSMMTLTTVGYGDIIPQNPMEYGVCTFGMLVVAYIWAYIVGKIVTILDQLDPHESHFRKSMDDLQHLMEARSLPEDLQHRMRSYMHQSKETARTNEQEILLQKRVSEDLQREVARCGALFDDFRVAITWASDISHDALLDLVRELSFESHGPNEVVQAVDVVGMLRRGIAAVQGRVLNRGDVYGQWDILLVSDYLKTWICPRTLSYVDIVHLAKQSLMKVCVHHPDADRRIRRAQVRTAVFRAFIQEAKERTSDRLAQRTLTSMELDDMPSWVGSVSGAPSLRKPSASTRSPRRSGTLSRSPPSSRMRTMTNTAAPLSQAEQIMDAVAILQQEVQHISSQLRNSSMMEAAGSTARPKNKQTVTHYFSHAVALGRRNPD
eukprot:TRINITY_DN31299_c0_g1_i1.p1 TRINITY_DN31299_c0_g1~~TRINITY_DN31299_c0_g1_i1.p1  ORF type:complete len:694 (-),score=115.84 TRINITY_DN31299_c0_g1_i1:124-2205(-)